MLIAVVALCTLENDVIHAGYLALALLFFRGRDELRAQRNRCGHVMGAPTMHRAPNGGAGVTCVGSCHHFLRALHGFVWGVCGPGQCSVLMKQALSLLEMHTGAVQGIGVEPNSYTRRRICKGKSDHLQLSDWQRAETQALSGCAGCLSGCPCTTTW